MINTKDEGNDDDDEFGDFDDFQTSEDPKTTIPSQDFPVLSKAESEAMPSKQVPNLVGLDFITQNT